MVAFHKLRRTAWSSRAHSTELISLSDGSRTVGGSEFHRVGPETAKLLCPHLAVLERGTASKVTTCCRTEMTDFN